MRRTLLLTTFMVISLLPVHRAAAEPPAGGIAVDGSFSLPLGHQRYPQDLAVVDTNVDGRNDVVATIFSETDGPQLQVFRQTSAGALVSARVITLTVPDTFNGRMPLAIADMDADGDQDVAVGVLDHIEIWTSSSSGLTHMSNVAIPSGVLDLWAADADLDGRTDLLAASFDLLTQVAKATLFRRLAGGGFAGSTPFTGASVPAGFSDATGDGRPDIEVSGDDGVGVAKQKVDGTFLAPVYRPVYGEARVGEFTGNNRSDIVVWLGIREGWVILAGKSDGTLASPAMTAFEANPYGDWTVGDLDGDGSDDLVANATSQFGTIAVSFQRDDGSFTADCDYFLGVNDSQYFDVVTVGDVTHDGRPDIVSTTYSLNVAKQITSSTATLDVTSYRTTFYVDEPVTVGGTFGMKVLDGGCWAGQILHVSRTNPSGATVNLGTIPTEWDGNWQFTETRPLPEGTYTYRFGWAGDAIRAAVSDTVQVHVVKRDGNATLDVPGQVRYGRDVAWRFTLGAFEDTAALSVDVSTNVGRIVEPLGTFPIDPATGVVSGVLPSLAQNTRLIVYWPGDSRYSAANLVRKIGVAPIVKGRMLRDAGTAGSVHLYEADRRVFYRTTVVPDHEGSPVRIVIEHRVSSTRWHEIAAAKFSLGRGSSVTVYFPARYLVVGDTYRIRGTFLRDSDHVTTFSAWSLFRVIRARRTSAAPSVGSIRAAARSRTGTLPSRLPTW